MKVIFFGLGSIGKRHLSNLTQVCEEKGIDVSIHAYRTSKPTSNIEGVKNVYHMNELESEYDVAFITNPTSLHYETINFIKDRVASFFIEKPIFHKIHPDISTWEYPDKYYIACPLRYKKVMRVAKEIVEKQKVLSARAICSTFLPNWRSGDYSKNYSADPNLGGGVELDCIHELDYIVDLFGFPIETKYMFGKVSSLEIKSNDTALYMLRYSDKFVELHLDYYGRHSQRKIEFITENDLITVDLITNQIASETKKEIVSFDEEYNQFYLNEMNYFVEQVISNKDNRNNLYHAHKVLELVLAS